MVKEIVALRAVVDPSEMSSSRAEIVHVVAIAFTGIELLEST